MRNTAAHHVRSTVPAPKVAAAAAATTAAAAAPIDMHQQRRQETQRTRRNSRRRASPHRAASYASPGAAAATTRAAHGGLHAFDEAAVALAGWAVARGAAGGVWPQLPPPVECGARDGRPRSCRASAARGWTAGGGGGAVALAPPLFPASPPPHRGRAGTEQLGAAARGGSVSADAREEPAEVVVLNVLLNSCQPPGGWARAPEKRLASKVGMCGARQLLTG
eukprot:364063-Chlamydomonas_euryale.AAC.7